MTTATAHNTSPANPCSAFERPAPLLGLSGLAGAGARDDRDGGGLRRRHT
jgi:hypothetical protein